VLLQCNAGSIDPGPLAHAVADVYLEGKMGPRPAVAATAASRPNASPAPAPADATLDALVGAYYNEDLDVTYRVARDRGLVLLRPGGAPVRLAPAGPDSLRAGSMTVRFEPADGTPTAMVLRVPRIGDLRFVRR
jgi:hypothetical protein